MTVFNIFMQLIKNKRRKVMFIDDGNTLIDEKVCILILMDLLRSSYVSNACKINAKSATVLHRM